MKRIGLVLMVLLALSALVACARGPKKSSEITIAVIPQQLGNPVFLPAQKGMEDAGKELGIKVEWQAPVRAEAELQNDVVNGLIERKVDGIAISCTTPDALKDVLARAIKDGIKVSCYDADSPASGRAFYAGTENYKAGFTCGEIMVKLFEGNPKTEIKIAQLEGIPGAFDIEARKRGFADAIKGSRLSVVYSGPCDDDVDKAIEIVEAFTRSNPEIDGWFMSGGWPYIVESGAMPVTNAWKLKSKDHKVVTLDVFPTSYDFFEQGLLDVAVGQNFYQMGYLSVMNLYKLIKGETIEANEVEGLGKFINTGTQIVTLDNYKTEIAK